MRIWMTKNVSPSAQQIDMSDFLPCALWSKLLSPGSAFFVISFIEINGSKATPHLLSQEHRRSMRDREGMPVASPAPNGVRLKRLSGSDASSNFPLSFPARGVIPAQRPRRPDARRKNNNNIHMICPRLIAIVSDIGQPILPTIAGSHKRPKLSGEMDRWSQSATKKQRFISVSMYHVPM
jgi:hypothetical protein